MTGENNSSVAAWKPGAGDTRGNDCEFTDEEDIYKTSPQIKIEYDEVFKEPEVYAKYFSIRKLTKLIYSVTQIAVYIIFSILFGIILSFLWGIFFAMLNFFSVFIMQPTAKALFVILRTNAMMLRAIVRSNLDPFYETFGLLFSRIKGRFSFNTPMILPTVAKTGQNAINEIV